MLVYVPFMFHLLSRVFVQGHPVIDYKVAVSRCKNKRGSSGERAVAAGLSKMLRRFSMDTTASKANKAQIVPNNEDDC